MVVQKIKNALADVPEDTPHQVVEEILFSLAERDYRDIFDGERVRVDSSKGNR